MTRSADAMGTQRPRLSPLAAVATVVGAAALVAALTLKSIQVGEAPADYYGTLSWLAPEIGLAPLAALLGLVAAILATGARDVRSAAIGLLGSGLATAGLAIALTHPPDNAMVLNRRCSQNVKAIATALTMYEADYGAFPPAARWMQDLGEYVDDPAVWKEPFTGKPGYALNAAIAGRPSDSFAVDPAMVVAVFESDRGANAAGGPELLPPRPRHHGGNHFGFLDEHVRWVPSTRPGQDTQQGLAWNPDTAPSGEPGAGHSTGGR